MNTPHDPQSIPQPQPIHKPLEGPTLQFIPPPPERLPALFFGMVIRTLFFATVAAVVGMLCWKFLNWFAAWLF